MNDQYQVPAKKTYDRDTLLKLSGSPLAKDRPINIPTIPGFTLPREVIDGALVVIEQSQDAKVASTTQHHLNTAPLNRTS